MTDRISPEPRRIVDEYLVICGILNDVESEQKRKELKENLSKIYSKRLLSVK